MNMVFHTAFFCIALAAFELLSLPVHAQGKWPPVSAAAEQRIAEIAKDARVAKALEAIKGDGARMFQEQVRLTEIPAPPFKESTRAQYFLKKVREAGLADARIDAEGNVIGVRRGSGRGPRLVVSAHLDTVFPEG